MTRTLRNNRGEEIQTPLTDEEAAQLCRRLNNKFCKELVAKYDTSRRPESRWALSEAQWYWLHKYALEGEHPQPVQPTTRGDFCEIVSLFDKVRRYVQFPKIRLLLPDGGQMKTNISVALSYSSGATSRFPNVINVTDGSPFGRSVFYGRIDVLGNFIRARNCPEAIVALLRQFAANPAVVASRHGHLHGKCCFCDNPLTDDGSVATGYGPVCAHNYGLPWGSAPMPKAVESDSPALREPPQFDDPVVQAEYERLIRGGLSMDEAAELAFDRLIQDADVEDSRRAASAKFARDEGH